jgi:hypothetical protein
MRIISGGQTGVDRGALDAAMQLGIPHGGWCPLSRLAEDGRIPDRYRLRESHSAEYSVRTEQNVLEGDATLILCRGRPSGGTELTLRLARQHGRPHLVVDLDRTPDAAAVRHWLTEQHVQTLNVAGPRESQSPGIGAAAKEFIVNVLRAVSNRPHATPPCSGHTTSS